MPIKDRTRRRLVRLGTIRLGIQVPNRTGNGTHPVQTDYFVLKDAPDVDAYFKERGIERPRELDVLLPFPDIDRNFGAWYQVWAGGVLVCKGDGEYVQYATPHRVEVKEKKKEGKITGHSTHVYNDKGDTLVSDGMALIAFDWNGVHFDAGDHVPCPGATQGLYPHCAACRLGCLLKVMMSDPDLFRMGYYQISTGSKRNYDTIMGMLEAMGIPDLRGIDFKLRLVEEQITFNDDGTRKKTNKWFLQLEPNPDDTRKAFKLHRQRTLKELPPPTDASPTPASPGCDNLVADDPEAPPFVVEGKDASSDEYYAGDLQDNGYLEGELETPVPHKWLAREAKKLTNWWRNVLVITDAKALELLGVTKIREFTGDYEAAQTTINAQVSVEANAEGGDG